MGHLIEYICQDDPIATRRSCRNPQQQFRLEVPENIPGVYYSISEWGGPNITISEPTAEEAYLFLDIFDDDGYTGQYIELNNTIDWSEEGDIYVEFIYVTKNCTINGFLEDVEGNTTEHTDIDLNLKVGWNAVAWKIENITYDGGYVYEEYKVSTDVSSSLTWKLMDYKK